MRLLRVELNRFRSRRAVALLVLAAVVVTVVLAILTAYQTRPLTASDRADARAQADLASTSSVLQDDLKDCIKDPEAYLGTNATAPECRDALVSDTASFYPRQPLSVGCSMPAASPTPPGSASR
jgi:ABC-2 type transport system permease protein